MKIPLWFAIAFFPSLKFLNNLQKSKKNMCMEVSTFVSIDRNGEDLSFQNLTSLEQKIVIGHFVQDNSWFYEMISYPFEIEFGEQLTYGHCWTFVSDHELYFNCHFRLPATDSLEKIQKQVQYGIEIGPDTWGEGSLPDIDETDLTVFPTFNKTTLHKC
jgi:hypothetical protein